MTTRTFFLNALSVGFLGLFAWGAIESTGPAGAKAAQETVRSDLGIQFEVPEAEQGVLRIAVFNSPESYNGGDPIAFKTVPVRSREFVTVNFADLKAGDYAVKVFYDEDRDAELDTNVVGIPSEAYGFSKNARSAFGPPDWNEAKFEFDGTTALRPIVLQ